MNENLVKQIVTQTGVFIAYVVGVTGFGFFTIKLCTKVYGPIEIKIKNDN